MNISRRAVGFMHKSNKYWRLYYGMVGSKKLISILCWFCGMCTLRIFTIMQHNTLDSMSLEIKQETTQAHTVKQWGRMRCTICTWVASPRMQKKNRIYTWHTNLSLIQRGEKKPDAWTQKANWHDTQRRYLTTELTLT